MFAKSRTVAAQSNTRTIGNHSSSGMQRRRGTKEMSTDPRGQYTGWRIAAIRSNETVGKCILARVRVVRYRKGGDIYTSTHMHHRSLPPSWFPPLSLSFSSPSSTFHPTLHLSRLNSRPCINYLVMPRVPRLDRNLCDLFRPRSHPPRCYTAIIYPRRSRRRGFLRSFFKFSDNDRIKSSVIANHNETNYLFQL